MALTRRQNRKARFAPGELECIAFGDDTTVMIGLCGACGFAGIIERTSKITNYEIDAMSGACSAETKERFLCKTCLDTPTGLRSSNQTHKRYPDSEYK